MTHDRPQIAFDIAPATVSAPYQIELQQIGWRVALGLNVIEHATDEALLLPTPFAVSPAANFKPDLPIAKIEFKKWIVANGLRDCAEAFHAHLEIVFGRCLLIKLGASTGSVPSEILEDSYDRARKQFHDANIDKKLAILENDFEISFGEVTLRCFRSLNKVRNCLSHRDGIVRENDCNFGTQLKVEWRVLLPIRSDGTEVEFGKPLNSTELYLRNDVRVRIFQLGDSIEFSSRDFAEFLNNYTLVCMETVDKVAMYAKSIGFQFIEKENITENDRFRECS
jgi:hypothetical protein